MLTSLRIQLLLLLACLSAVLGQPVWGGYGGYPLGWESTPLALPSPGLTPWHMERPYYHQYHTMTGVYSPEHTQYMPYAVAPAYINAF